MKAFVSRRKILVEGHAVAFSTWAILWMVSRVFEGQSLPGTQCSVTGCRQTSWFDFLLIVTVAHFLYVKSWLMLRRTNKITWLGLSLVWTNLAFAVTYQMIVVITMFPQLREHAWITNLIRIEVLVPVIVASILLTFTTDPDPDSQSTWNENVRLVAEEGDLRSQIASLSDQIERQGDEPQRGIDGAGNSGADRPDALGNRQPPGY